MAVLFIFLLSTKLKAQNSQTVPTGGNTTAITFPGTGCVYNWVNNNPAIGLAASGTSNIASFTAVNNGTTPVTATITATPVNNGYAYIANSGSDNVSVINTLTHTVVATVPIANQPWATAISPDGKHAYVVSTNNDRGRSATGTLSVIDAITNTITATIDLGRNALAVVVSPDGTKAYVTNRTSNTISVIDLVTNSLISDIQIPSPLGLAISPDGGKLYITADGLVQGTLYVLNTSNNQQIATVPIGCNNITGGVLVTASAGFEVSADNITFSNTITVGSIGNIESIPVYIRSKSTSPTGNYSGNVVLSSNGATSVNIPVNSVITAAPLTITADDKSKFIGDPNPVFTVKYSGFVNGEGPAQLTQQPVASTTAVAASPLGKYPITVRGTIAGNYTINYVAGVLDVISGAINAPNAFTPNGDGVNDTWDIKFLDLYANCTVEVLNRYGGSIFYSVGYPVAWNGKRNAIDIPSGTYYYIIKLNNGTKPIMGYVAVIR
jgi:gliding motility-associated-like protein